MNANDAGGLDGPPQGAPMEAFDAMAPESCLDAMSPGMRDPPEPSPFDAMAPKSCLDAMSPGMGDWGREGLSRSAAGASRARRTHAASSKMWDAYQRGLFRSQAPEACPMNANDPGGFDGQSPTVAFRCGFAPRVVCCEAKRSAASRGFHRGKIRSPSETFSRRRLKRIAENEGTARTSPWPWGCARGAGSAPSHPVGGRAAGQSGDTRTDEVNSPWQGEPVHPGTPEGSRPRAMVPIKKGHPSGQRLRMCTA